MRADKFLNETHPILSDRTRLVIMATLASREEPIDFNSLVESVNLTKGNLSAHIQKLEDCRLVTVKKEFVGKKPRTTYVCSDEGRRELKAYLKRVENLLKGI